MGEASGNQDLARALHAARPDALAGAIVDAALRECGASHGALFAWDDAIEALRLTHHVVEGVVVTLPDRVISRDGERAGIAIHAFDKNAPYLCSDTTQDPRYTRYLSDVGSIAAVPLRWQSRPIGVLTVATEKKNAFREELLAALSQVAEIAAPLIRRADLDKDSRRRTGKPFLIKGLSDAWREVERRIELASPTSAPILVCGESGTGKDLVSRAIHFNSKRADSVYVTVNCAALPENLLESTLFGHRKGAFTGAVQDKIGEFKKADGGTLFLDEIGELPLTLQAKVLRAVEQGEISPLGSNRAPEQVDVRLVCATHRDLATMSREGEFREDLYYRLSVMTLDLPPLRSYKDNIEVLANVFLEDTATRFERLTPRIGHATMALLKSYDYPGNVRELRNAIEHALILTVGETIKPSHLPAALYSAGRSRPVAPDETKRATLKEKREEWLAPLEKEYLESLLRAHKGNVKAASRDAGISAVTFYKLLRKREITVTKETRFD